ncbi:L,D-transpeptidase [Actinomadura gamaensis]|uniref:Ig-like domain-containing protein n=1 Tax=Actinomadura gamaensis TaxID=1763541 RepID=A0ABV9UG94_9ACTN
MGRTLTAGVRTGAGLTALTLALTACGGGEKHAGANVDGKAEAGTPQLTITPGNGEGRAAPDAGVVVKVAGGTLDQVVVTRKGKPVEGEMSADRTTWRSRTLRPGSQYQVQASARGPKGKTATATSAFGTVKAGRELEITDVTPGRGEKVGIGMPIMVSFNRDVDDRKAVEKSFQVKSEKPAVGAWKWIDDSHVVFRTKNGQYWQPNQKVTFSAKLSGVKAGKRTYGVDDFTRGFRIGDAHMVTVNVKTHRLVVKKNGVKVNGWGISAGRGGRIRNGVDVYETTSGVHLTMGKENPAIMTSEWMGVKPEDKANGGYKEVIPFAVRISDSGEYIHSMASTVWAQGSENVSHGCVNSPPSKAEWYYSFSYLGDPVVITGTDRDLPWNNGWGFYQQSWAKWLRGSALGQEVNTGG